MIALRSLLLPQNDQILLDNFRIQPQNNELHNYLMLDLIIFSRIFSLPLLALVTRTPSAIVSSAVITRLIMPRLIGLRTNIVSWTLSTSWCCRSRAATDYFLERAWRILFFVNVNFKLVSEKQNWLFVFNIKKNRNRNRKKAHENGGHSYKNDSSNDTLNYIKYELWISTLWMRMKKWNPLDWYC